MRCSTTCALSCRPITLASDCFFLLPVFFFLAKVDLGVSTQAASTSNTRPPAWNFFLVIPLIFAKKEQELGGRTVASNRHWTFHDGDTKKGN